MMKHTLLAAGIGLVAVLNSSDLALASEGHDHGDAAPATAGTVLPRFAAVSEAFELVGVLEGRRITLYLDRSADNSPVVDAQIELEIADAKLKAVKHGVDAFEVTLPTDPTPGVLPITATVTVGQEVDLLAGELDLHEAEHAEAAAHTHSWREYAGWGGAAVAALMVLIVVARRLVASRALRTAGAA